MRDEDISYVQVINLSKQIKWKHNVLTRIQTCLFVFSAKQSAFQKQCVYALFNAFGLKSVHEHIHKQEKIIFKLEFLVLLSQNLLN